LALAVYPITSSAEFKKSDSRRWLAAAAQPAATPLRSYLGSNLSNQR
jgi:hypothetical protein